MYKAIKEIGGYKIGDEVPEEKAKVWLKMYSVPQVEKVDGEGTPKDTEVTSTSDEPDAMLDDYLGRNESVVRSNVKKDDLNKKQLDGLLELEKSGKKRTSIIVAIKNKLKRLGD